jgi:hypothetical protein
VAVRNEGERLVLAVTDQLQTALASADDARLAQVAVPLSQTEEFWGGGDPTVVAKGVRRLAGLASLRRAAGRLPGRVGHHRRMEGSDLITKPAQTRRYDVRPHAARTITAPLTLRNHVIALILAGVRSPWWGR